MKKNENDFLQELSTELVKTQMSLDLVISHLQARGLDTDGDSDSILAVAQTLKYVTKAIDQRRIASAPTGAGPAIETDQKFTVLVVDDDQILRSVASDIFKKSGHSVFEAANGSDALDIIRNVDVDIVLTDLNMPDVDGLKFTQTIRSENIKQPVLCLMSGDPDRLNFVQSVVKAEGALVKPFNRKAIVESILLAIRNRN